MSVSCSTSHFMSLFTTGLILLNLISTFLHHPIERKVIGLVLLTTKVTVSPGGSSLRILTRLSFVLAFEALSELQQTSILHHLQGRGPHFLDRILSTAPGAEPPRDARDSGSARSHSTHLETSSSDRPKLVTYTEPQTVPSYMSVTCTRRTLRMPTFTHATHAQPSLSNFPWRDSDFGERTRSRGTTLGEQNFPTSPQNKITKLTHCSIYTSIRTISSPHTK